MLANTYGQRIPNEEIQGCSGAIENAPRHYGNTGFYSSIYREFTERRESRRTPSPAGGNTAANMWIGNVSVHRRYFGGFKASSRVGRDTLCDERRGSAGILLPEKRGHHDEILRDAGKVAHRFYSGKPEHVLEILARQSSV